MSLIEVITTATRSRLAERQHKVTVADLRARIADAPRAKTTFRDAITRPPLTLIAEIKSRSPSSGSMDETNVSNALQAYDGAVAVAAISILTDEDHFGGHLEDLWRARQGTSKPILRKDFILNEYQVLEARAFGADAVLIMSGLHTADPHKAAALVSLAKELRMDVLFELGMNTSGIEAQRKLIGDAEVIWGINSRRFNTSPARLRSRIGVAFGRELSTDNGVHSELRKMIPDGQVAVAESGISSPSYLRELQKLGYQSALIGTAFLKKGVRVASEVAAYDREVASMGDKTETANQPLRSRLPVPTA
jgi:indole-3-glycerol phosphate synthase